MMKKQIQPIITMPDLLALEPSARILCVAAHPDDETLGCGGTLWTAGQTGGEVCVVLLTAGENEGGENLPGSDQLKLRRLDEFRNAMAILGVRSFEVLDGEDRRLSTDVPRLSNDLTSVLEAFRPTMILMPHTEDAHADHRAAAQVVLSAVAQTSSQPRLFAYETWAPVDASHVIDITPCKAIKRRALDCYAERFVRNDIDNAILALNRYRAQCILLPPGSAVEAYREIFS